METTGNMSSRAITQELVDTLLAFYRSHPGQITEAARHAGVSRPTARKAWIKGFPNLYGGKCLEQVLRDEQAAARAQMLRDAQARQAQAEADREAARQSAIQSRKEEGMMVGYARSTVAQALIMANQCITGAKALSARLKQVLEAEATKPVPDMSPESMVRMLRETTLLTNRLSDAAHTVMQMERLHLGQPTDILGITGVQAAVPVDITLEEAELRIQAAQRAAAATRRARGLHLVHSTAEAGQDPDSSEAAG